MSAEALPPPQPSLFDVPDREPARPPCRSPTAACPTPAMSDRDLSDRGMPDRRHADPTCPTATCPISTCPTLTCPISTCTDRDLPDLDVPDFVVSVRRSKRRRKSVGGQLVGGTLLVTVPSWMSKADEAHAVADMVRRFTRRRSAERFDLPGRAARLARRHGLERPAEIRWSDSMQSRWGSCTPATGAVRLSTRLASFPDWVVDYVLVHELAHLSVADHSPAFWSLVERYPLAERARGYLIAKSGDAEADDDL